MGADPSSTTHTTMVEPSSKRSKVQSTPSENEAPCWSNVCADVFLLNILPFLGTNQYRFVGAVNRHFRSVYKALYSSTTTTYDNIVCMEQAILCYEEIKKKPRQLEKLWRVLTVLQE
jgi:hypothetical protein